MNKSKKRKLIIAVACVVLIIAVTILVVVLATMKRFDMTANDHFRYNNHTEMNVTSIPTGKNRDNTDTKYHSNATIRIIDETTGRFGYYSYISNKIIVPTDYTSSNTKAIDLVDHEGNELNTTIFKTTYKGTSPNNQIAYYDDEGNKIDIVNYNADEDQSYSYIRQRVLDLYEKRSGIKANAKNKFKNIKIAVSDINYEYSYIDNTYNYEIWTLRDTEGNKYTNLYSLSGSNRKLIQTINNSVGNNIQTTEEKSTVAFLKDGNPIIISTNILAQDSDSAMQSVTVYDINYKEKDTVKINLNETLNLQVNYNNVLYGTLVVGNSVYFQYKIPANEKKYDFSEIDSSSPVNTTKYYKLETYRLNIKNGHYKKIDFNYLIENVNDNFNNETVLIKARKIKDKVLQNSELYIVNDRLQTKAIGYNIDNITKITKDRYLVTNSSGQYLINKKYEIVCFLGDYDNLFTTSESVILEDWTSGYTYVCTLDGLIVKKYLNKEISNANDDIYYMVETEVERQGKIYTEKYLERLGVRKSTPIYSVEKGSSEYKYNDKNYVGYSDTIMQDGVSIITRVKQVDSKYAYEFYNLDGKLLLELGNFDTPTSALTFLNYSDDDHMLVYISNKGVIGYTLVIDR